MIDARLLLAAGGLTLLSAGGASAAQTGTSDPLGDNSEDTIVVKGRGQKLYRVGETDTGKLPSDPLSSPIVITTINEQLIEDQGARDAQDIYRNISGVSLFSYAGVTARGFRQEEIFFDGLRGDPYVGFNVPQLFNIERLDFLKGPAGMLYGPGSPGGLFNYVTKKPSEDFSAEVRAIYGSEARYGGSFEVTGALPVEGSAGRFGIFHEDRNLPRRGADSVVTIYDAGVSQDFGFAKLTLQATRYEQDQAGNRLRGVPVGDNGEFLTDRRWNHNEDSDFLNLVSNNFQALIDGDIGPQFTWNAALRYTQSEQDQQYHEPIRLIDVDDRSNRRPNPADAEFVARQFRDQLREEEQLSFGVNGIWSKELGRIDYRLLVGYEYFDGQLDFTNGRFNTSTAIEDRFFAGTSLPGDILPLSLRDPQYGVTRPDQYAVAFAAPRETGQVRQGGYLLKEATMGPFTLVGGVRFDRFEDEINADQFDDENTTFRLGGVYRPREDVSLFVQWAESYEPQDIRRQTPEVGGPFDPTEGNMVEGGIKTSLLNGRLNTTATIYEIVRTNVLQARQDLVDADQDGFEDLEPVGEVTSRGFEFDVVADVTPDWVITLAYAYNDTTITGSNGDSRAIINSVGDRFANAPEHQLGFWTRYQVPAIDTAFALGGDYVSERISLSGQPVNSYFTLDASIIYSPGPFEILLRADNLLDEEFAESGFLDRTGHFPGAPRSAFIELIKRW